MSVMDDHYFTELYESMRLHFQVNYMCNRGAMMGCF